MNEPTASNAFDYSRYFWAGEKVLLRGLRVADAEVAYAASLDSPARQLLQLGIELPTSVDALRVELEKRSFCKTLDGVVVFAIEPLSRPGGIVGTLSLHSRSSRNGTFGFGVNIHAAYRKKGYAEDAVRVLLRFGFHEQRLQKCNSACVDGNQASIALHKKLGFVEEGRRRRQFFLNGRYVDDILYGLTREEFDAVSATRRT
ncbi:GNAT family N-acetyltransferase [Candidatus Bipolaricaulota bacterium]|nr:GNAT family N-acetyltransferase [Candidatus Bipolaricaulota bacterium]